MKIREHLNRSWPLSHGLFTAMIVLALASSFAWAGKPPKPPPESGYRLVGLGVGNAKKINDHGWVVGESFLNPGPGVHAFVLIPQDTNQDGVPDTWYAGQNGVNELVIDLGTLGGSMNQSWAGGINDLGQVVGTSYTGYGTQHAFLWQSGAGGMLDLGVMGDMDMYSLAYAINNKGQIVGESGESHGRAFLINPLDTDNDGMPDTWFVDDGQGYNDLMIDLGGETATDINDLGEIVGTSGGYGFLIRPADVDKDGKLDWFWGQNGINELMIPLPPSGGASSSSAVAINTDGLILGASGADVVLWQVDRTTGVISEVNLGHIKGYVGTVPRDLNDDGEVVGYAFSFIGGNLKEKSEACVSEDGVMVKLADQVVDWGPCEDEHSQALGINGRGEIVGGDWAVGGFIAIPLR